MVPSSVTGSVRAPLPSCPSCQQRAAAAVEDEPAAREMRGWARSHVQAFCCGTLPGGVKSRGRGTGVSISKQQPAASAAEASPLGLCVAVFLTMLKSSCLISSVISVPSTYFLLLSPAPSRSFLLQDQKSCFTGQKSVLWSSSEHACQL